MSGGYTKAELERALTDALAPLTLRGGGYVRTVEPYRGELAAREIPEKALQPPAVFVGFVSSSYGPGPQLYATESASFNVVVVARAGGEPDVYKLLADTRDLLCGGAIAPGVGPLKLVSETTLMATSELTAVSALYTLTQRVRLKT